MAKWEIDLIEAATDQDLAHGILRAVNRLLELDKDMFGSDVNERSISHRLAIYLEVEFLHWNVDCEYNRDGHNPKRLRLTPQSCDSDDLQGTTVYPDIILHHRGRSGTEHNLLAIEIKKDTGQAETRDLEKLRALREQLGYRFGLFLQFQTGAEKPTVGQICWFPEADFPGL